MKLSLVILIFLIVVAMGRASMPNTLEQLPAKQSISSNTGAST